LEWCDSGKLLRRELNWCFLVNKQQLLTPLMKAANIIVVLISYFDYFRNFHTVPKIPYFFSEKSSNSSLFGYTKQLFVLNEQG